MSTCPWENIQFDYLNIGHCVLCGKVNSSLYLHRGAVLSIEFKWVMSLDEINPPESSILCFKSSFLRYIQFYIACFVTVPVCAMSIVPAVFFTPTERLFTFSEEYLIVTMSLFLGGFRLEKTKASSHSNRFRFNKAIFHSFKPRF